MERFQVRQVKITDAEIKKWRYDYYLNPMNPIFDRKMIAFLELLEARKLIRKLDSEDAAEYLDRFDGDKN